MVDGGSTDRTVEVVDSICSANPRIRLIHNPKRIQAVAVNIGASAADPRARYFVRADCHATYPPGFVARCLQTITSTNAASVVVPMLTRGTSFMQRAIAAAQNSRLGNGGGAQRSAGRSRFVDHGHHAVFDRKTFLALGGYDEEFSHNEDAEFDLRLTASGSRIYLDAENAIIYYPRSTLTALARQYFAFGRGRACTVMKHHVWPKPRQLLPLAALVGSLAGVVLAPLTPAALALPASYASVCIAVGVMLAWREKAAAAAASGLAAMVMHQAWACGFLVAVLPTFHRALSPLSGYRTARRRSLQ